MRHISPALGLEDQRSIVADNDGAWVVGQSDGLLYRIEDGRVVKRLRVGRQAGVIARTRSAVWVTAPRATAATSSCASTPTPAR